MKELMKESYVDLYKQYGFERKNKKACGYLEDVGGAGDIAIIVLPGGGYSFRSNGEKYNVAEAFSALGYHTFILHYSIKPVRFPYSFFEVSAAVDFVKKLGFKVGVMGFSAGGHLTGCSATLFNKPFAKSAVERTIGKLPDDFSSRPDFAVLCYAVISSKKGLIDKSTFRNLCGPLDSKLKTLLSLEEQVDDETPPCFLWHTQSDMVVSCQNTEVFYQALLKHNVKARELYFPRGRHGLSLGDNLHPDVKEWVGACDEFIRSIF